MRRVKIDIKLTCKVLLSDIEVDDEFAELLVRMSHLKFYPNEYDENKARVSEWITDNIHEDDCYDYVAKIEGLIIDDNE